MDKGTIFLIDINHFRMLSREFSGMSFGPSQVRYNYVILLIIESGVVMTISKTLEFVLFQLAPDDGLNGNNALYIVMDCMPQIMVRCFYCFLKFDDIYNDLSGYLSNFHHYGRQQRLHFVRFWSIHKQWVCGR